MAVNYQDLIQIIIVFLCALIPFLLYLLLQSKFRGNFSQREYSSFSHRSYEYIEYSPPSQDFFPLTTEVQQPFIGDIGCLYNAHSPYLRCAINPTGDCKTCQHYEAKY
ncbi:MAG: hypothetical protein D6756_12215 [Cyanobacteria bacterium J083]|nr:MAG: hypothetical protein D6756_12215 [Cyanobacteria bacterium J083]